MEGEGDAGTGVGDDQRPDAQQVGVEARTAGVPAEGESEARVHDFSRSEALPRAVVQALERMCSSFARAAAAALSAYLRTQVEVSSLGLTQETYDRYVQSAPERAAVAIFRMGPLPGRGLLQLESDTAAWINDYLLGGKGEIDEARGGPSEVEKALLGGPVSRLLGELGTAWEEFSGFEPELTEMVGSVRTAEAAKAMEAMVAARFAMEVDAFKGGFGICVPAISLKLGWAGETRAGDEAVDAASRRGRLAAAAMAAEVTCAVRLGRVSMSPEELAELVPGDVLCLDRASGADLEMLVAGKPKFRCRPVRSGDRVAAEIAGEM